MRMSSFAQESQRYVGYGGAIEFIIPPWVQNINPVEFDTDDSEFISKLWENYNQAEVYWMGSMITSSEMYKSLLDEGWRPEQARDVLPNACKTEINVQTNLREWMHIFDLRAAPAAAPQMREIMISALADIKQLIPIVFDDI